MFARTVVNSMRRKAKKYKRKTPAPPYTVEFGWSKDPKPESATLSSFYIERDTNRRYIWNGECWALL